MLALKHAPELCSSDGQRYVVIAAGPPFMFISVFSSCPPILFGAGERDDALLIDLATSLVS